MLEGRKIISLGIPDDIFDEVEEVTRALFEYKNPNKLNWNKSYEDVLIKLGKKDKLKDYRLLTFVIRRITEYGHDIYDTPFRLEAFR